MRYFHPDGLLAGFHAERPDPQVPELCHIGEQWAPRQFFVGPHHHSVWEFYLQISGESHWDGPEQSYTLTAGHFFAVPPQMPHQMHDLPSAKHHFFFAAIDLAVVLLRLPSLCAVWQREAILHVPSGETALAPFRHLIREVSLPLPHRALGLRLALDSLVVEASRLRESDRVPPSLALRHPAVLRVKELLDHQPEQAWRLAELARRAGLSPTHLAERFTSEIGLAPHQYLLRVRIDRAREMLTQTDIAITDLALELGFSSSQHFAATFKRLTGENAQRYRNQQRSNQK